MAQRSGRKREGRCVILFLQSFLKTITVAKIVNGTQIKPIFSLTETGMDSVWCQKMVQGFTLR